MDDVRRDRQPTAIIGQHGEHRVLLSLGCALDCQALCALELKHAPDRIGALPCATFTDARPGDFPSLELTLLDAASMDKLAYDERPASAKHPAALRSNPRMLL
jgi:hypothetical protein